MVWLKTKRYTYAVILLSLYTANLMTPLLESIFNSNLIHFHASLC